MKRRKMNIAITLLVIIVLMMLVIIYTTRLFYRISVSNINEVGVDKATGLTVQLENYLDTAKNVLWVTAGTVDYMVSKGDSTGRILEYLIRESKNQEKNFDENYTGIYGYVSGKYLDGVGWVPPEGYEPKERDWYQAALKAHGDSTIVSPYVDAQTGAVIISISRMLSDGESVISLDVTMNEIQRIISEVGIKNQGYGFIVNEDGMIIAHRDSTLNGMIYSELDPQSMLMENLEKEKSGSFQAFIGGVASTVFFDQVLDQWYAVIVVKNDVLYQDVWSQLIVNILVYMFSFSIISLVCVLSYRNEWSFSKRYEELKISEQKQEYEAKMLRLEKAAADASNRAKGEFLAEMSHEIRTPINAVLGMNEMILRETSDDHILQYAGNIQSAGRTLLSIINDILDFSKIEDGKMEILPVKYDLSIVIHNLVNSITERAAKKGLSFTVEVDETLPIRLYGDDVRITQVIMNLMTNAVKYTEQGGITFTVKDGGREDKDIFLDVCVKDTGIGIKEEDRAKLFESFERLEEKRNRNIEGTGLGMSIVTKLLGMMGSNIQLESEYGKGSSFSFRLRQTIVDSEPIGDYAERIGKTVKNKEEEVYFYAPGASVLVVDDNGMNLEVVRNLMKRDGITPDLASSGQEAIEKIRNKHYDIVFLDHMMPKMDGIETLQKLKEEKLLAEDVTVIALTANAVVGAKEMYLKAGFDDYLSKPIDADALERKLGNYLPSELITYRKAEKEAQEALEFSPGGESEALEFMPAGDEEEIDRSELIKRIAQIGLRTESGLRYCGNDSAFYVEILKDYYNTGVGKRQELERYFQTKDWKSYQILVHSLKSSSKTIGAERISEMARFLEVAADSNDIAYLEKEHGGFALEYQKLCSELERICSK